ncbi:hypothetical protein [Pseudomonas brassicacearum]|jgi:uridine kinase|uniref:Uncharacterized protein n=1 Tax=Pseudomonas brassicacearum TaxID=930166 RepID=A0A423JHX5_9PSED|nr:hypothetical protein [Pseudomonas brassicacearum]RON37328.1 hypothetical protein BK664_18415 [Pseudomonas brassicacearum]
MDVELHQFQKDLLESVREMNASRVVRTSDVRPRQTENYIEEYMSLSATHHKNVSPKLENSDT